MRDAFIKTLLDCARQDPSILLITGDLGYGVLDTFESELPQQFINAGVAEQSMVGLAAGLASSGFRCFVYSIANFSSLRCLEQVRNDVCYHNLPVTLVSVGAGLSYGTLGYSHHAIEDVAAMRAFHNMSVLNPADDFEAAQLTSWLSRNRMPSYLRLGKGGPSNLGEDTNWAPPSARRLRKGNDRAVLVSGAISSVALEVANSISEIEGIESEVWSFPSIKPLDENVVLDLTNRFTCVLTIEEHVQAGGFGSAVSELLSRHAIGGVRIRNLFLDDTRPHVVGDLEYLRGQHGLSPDQIRSEIRLAK